jgi:type II secretory pathway pseudopilin PulG
LLLLLLITAPAAVPFAAIALTIRQSNNMNPIAQQPCRVRHPAFSSAQTAAFSLVELLGVIVLIGIISLGAYMYVGNASQQAILNTKIHNVAQLNQLVSIANATGATVGVGVAQGAGIDTTSAQTAIASLNYGFSVGTGPNPIQIKMTPPIQTPGSYNMNNTGSNIVFVSDGRPDTQP